VWIIYKKLAREAHASIATTRREEKLRAIACSPNSEFLGEENTSHGPCHRAFTCLSKLKC